DFRPCSWRDRAWRSAIPSRRRGGGWPDRAPADSRRCAQSAAPAGRGEPPRSHPARFAGEPEQHVKIEIALEVGGKAVERCFDLGFVAERARNGGTEAGEEGGAEIVGGEEAVEVGADDP